MKTEQELFWINDFGNEYTDRCSHNNEEKSAALIRWAWVLSKLTTRPQSVFEIGCNLGKNIEVLSDLLPDADINAVEINAKAAKIAQERVKATISNCSIFEFNTTEQYDLVFTVTVMIHINPELLDSLYEKIYKMSKKYIIIAEYYNPTPTEVNYRGHEGKLFKRDFAGELLEKYKDLRLVDYKFYYKRDPLAFTDDTTFFILEKI